jgi:hypothetical protein
MRYVYATVTTVLLTAILVGGCGGAATILKAIGLIKVYDLALHIRERIGENEEEPLTVLLDGYQVRTDAPNRAGALELEKLPQGTYLVSLVTADRRRGWHQVVEIGQAAGSIEVAPFSGAVISGRVVRQLESGGTAPVKDVLVAAFQDGAARLATGQGPLRLGGQGASGQLLAMTDPQGNFRLGPAPYGTWLVAAAAPGFTADADVVTVGAGRDATGVTLTLQPTAEAKLGTVAGSVVKESTGAPLPAALVRAELGSLLVPLIPASTRQKVQSATGLTLPAGRWFAWPFVPASTGAAGDYLLSLPLGFARLWAYSFGYAGTYRDLTVTAGPMARLDFQLPKP